MFPHGVPDLNILCLHKDMMLAEADDSITQSQQMLPRTPEQNCGHLPTPGFSFDAMIPLMFNN